MSRSPDVCGDSVGLALFVMWLIVGRKKSQAFVLGFRLANQAGGKRTASMT